MKEQHLLFFLAHNMPEYKDMMKGYQRMRKLGIEEPIIQYVYKTLTILNKEDLLEKYKDYYKLSKV